MKKIIITFAIIIASLSGFSQSFSVDNKSLSVPRYADQAAITAAITTPTTGMLVFNNTLNQYAYWNGTAWTNFPAASGQTNPIDSTRIISAARIPSLQALKTSGTIAAPAPTQAGRLFNIQSYGRSSTATLLSGEISFRASQAFTNFSDPASSEIFFSTKGVAAPLTDRMMISENGRFGFGSISSAGYVPSGNVDFNFSQASEAVPTLHLRGGGSGNSTTTRYSRNNATNGPGAGIVLTSTLNNNTASGASLAWKHYDDTVPPTVTQTPMMTITGQGDLTVHGFSKFGGSASAFPAMKTMMLTGTTAASGLFTTVLHGLTASKIIGFQVIVAGGVSSDIYVSSNSPDPGMTFFSAYDAGSFYITINI